MSASTTAASSTPAKWCPFATICVPSSTAPAVSANRRSVAAVVDADTGLGLPDFRAEERTFQLLTQLAGRSGRDAPGRVIVQTFQPDARAVVHASRHDVAGFLEEELERRRLLGYPPEGAQDLAEDWRRTARRSRAVMERLFYG